MLSKTFSRSIFYFIQYASIQLLAANACFNKFDFDFDFWWSFCVCVCRSRPQNGWTDPDTVSGTESRGVPVHRGTYERLAPPGKYGWTIRALQRRRELSLPILQQLCLCYCCCIKLRWCVLTSSVRELTHFQTLLLADVSRGLPLSWRRLWANRLCETVP